MTNFVKAIYHSNIKAAEFIAEDGRHCIRSGGSLQWQICNAGDLSSPVTNGMPTPKKTKNYIGFAKTGSGHHFFIFPDYATGRAQLKASILRKYHEKTLSEMVKIYAPSTDGNDTNGYVSKLSKLSGIDRDTKIKDLKEAQLDSLMDGIERLEGYHADADTRKEIWVDVSHIQATDGTRPLANEEIVLRTDGQEVTLKSNVTGHFPAIVHGESSTTVHHKTIDGELKPVGELPKDKSQHWSLVTKVSEFFSKTAPVKAPENPITNKQALKYTVLPGDSLGKIAKRFKVSVSRIKQDNHLIKDTILPGQVLGINGVAPAIPAAAPAKKAAPKTTTHETTKAAAPEPKDGASKPPPHAPKAEEKTIAARSKEGKGEPLALIEAEDGVAPWMKYALAEAKRHKGADEAVIEKDVNYHKEIKDGTSSLVGKLNAWCAAFVNWSLMKAGYSIENPKELGFVDRVAAKARADGFIRLRGEKNDKKQKNDDVSFVLNPLYKKIEEPIYGAIAIVVYPTGVGHHAGFVYGRVDDNNVCVLGGNQGDTISFASFNIKPIKATIEMKNGKKTKRKGNSDGLIFLLPVAYHHEKIKGAKEIQTVVVSSLNKEIGIETQSKVSTTVKTR